MRVRVEGIAPNAISAKDIILEIIGRIGTSGGTGYAIEFAGQAIRALSHALTTWACGRVCRLATSPSC